MKPLDKRFCREKKKQHEKLIDKLTIRHAKSLSIIDRNYLLDIRGLYKKEYKEEYKGR